MKISSGCQNRTTNNKLFTIIRKEIDKRENKLKDNKDTYKRENKLKDNKDTYKRENKLTKILTNVVRDLGWLKII